MSCDCHVTFCRNCSGCKRSPGAVKKIEIWKLPAILLIALSRFTHDGLWKEKRQNYIDYPVGWVTCTVTCTCYMYMHMWHAHVTCTCDVMAGGRLLAGRWVAISPTCLEPVAIYYIKRGGWQEIKWWFIIGSLSQVLMLHCSRGNYLNNYALLSLDMSAIFPFSSFLQELFAEFVLLCCWGEAEGRLQIIRHLKSFRHTIRRSL